MQNIWLPKTKNHNKKYLKTIGYSSFKNSVIVIMIKISIYNSAVHLSLLQSYCETVTVWSSKVVGVV